MDTYHTRKATDRLDEVYALLGMSSDDPTKAGISANYEAPWGQVFQRLVHFSLSHQIAVDTWDQHNVAIIRGKGHILGRVSSSHDDGGGRQDTHITWKTKKRLRATEIKTSKFILPAPAKHVQTGDVVCLLQGASKPTIIRPSTMYSAVIMIAFPLWSGSQPTNTKWLDVLQSVSTFPISLLLFRDWDAFERKPQDEKYECFISSQGGGHIARNSVAG